MARLPWSRPSVAALLLAASACSDGVQPEVDPPQQYITQRRAWRAGERDSAIAHIEQSGGFGQFSSLAPVIFHPDSVTEVIPNPALLSPAAPGLSALQASRYAPTWLIAGVRYENYNSAQVPADTLIWTGLFWSDPIDSGSRGFIIRAGASLTFDAIPVHSTNFDASEGRAGAGGIEVALFSGTVWSAIGANAGNSPIPIPGTNNIEVASASFGATTTVTSGAWLGGEQASGTMTGRVKRVVFTRTQGSADPAMFELDLDFRDGIQAARLVCNFPNPCTTDDTTAALRRASRSAR